MKPSLVHSQVTRYIIDILSLIMDPRYVTLFIFLVLALHGDTTLAGLYPSQIYSVLPY